MKKSRKTTAAGLALAVALALGACDVPDDDLDGDITDTTPFTDTTAPGGGDLGTTTTTLGG